MKQGGRSVKLMDIILIALVLAATILSGIRIYGNTGGKQQLVIEAPGGSWIYDLKTDRTVEIPGVIGNNFIKIEKNSARIIDSPCPNKTCIAAPAISHKGEWNACLPNKVIIRIEGDDEPDGMDAIGY